MSKPTPESQVIIISSGAGVIKIINHSNQEINPILVKTALPLVEEKLSGLHKTFVADVKIVEMVIKQHTVYIPIVIIDMLESNTYFRMECNLTEDLEKLFMKTIETIITTLIEFEYREDEQEADNTKVDTQSPEEDQPNSCDNKPINVSPLEPMTEKDFQDIISHLKKEK